MDHINATISISCVDAEDVSRTIAMLKHLKRRYLGADRFTLDESSCCRIWINASGWCGGVGVTPWYVLVMCWEPPLISLEKDEAAMLCAADMLVVLVIFCPQQLKIDKKKKKKSCSVQPYVVSSGMIHAPVHSIEIDMFLPCSGNPFKFCHKSTA